MSNIGSIFKAVEFVEAHLQEEIAVADIASAVSYSLYHFCRMFSQIVHHTPYDYLMRRRLSESARELVETDKKIIDIAFDYQFNSPETYSRAFKRMFDMQPSQWKKRGRADRWSLMSRLTLAHLEHIHRENYLRSTLEEMECLHVAGLMTVTKDDQAAVSQIWELLTQELESAGGVDKPLRWYGITWYPRDWEERGLLYMAALEGETAHALSPALVTKTIPPSKYARFIHRGLQNDLSLTRDYIYQTWLPKSGQCRAYPLEIEYFGQEPGGINAEDSERAIYIPIR